MRSAGKWGHTGKNGTVRLTVNSTAGMESGDNCYVTDVEGTTEANGCRQMTVINGTNLELQGTTFSHAWISGGTVRYLDAVHYFMPEFLAVFKGFAVFALLSGSRYSARPWRTGQIEPRSR